MTDLVVMTNWAWILGAAGLGVALFIYGYVKKQPPGNALMIDLGEQIHDGAMAFLRREYSVLAIFVAIVAVLLALAIGTTPAIAYVFGALASVAAGFIGMKAATRANTRTSAAANTDGQGKALRIAFFGGAVMGLSVAALGLLGLGVLYVVYASDAIVGRDFENFAEIISGFAMGASTIALFARVGGGIYTKAADVGADLVGKVEAGIPEDDPRNPATIADNVGDNVGDVAGMGADIFESYVGSIVATIAIAATAPTLVAHRAEAVALPILTVMVGLLASLLAIGMMKLLERSNPAAALRNVTFIAAGVFLAVMFLVVQSLGINFADAETGRAYPAIGPWVAILAGTLVGIAIGLVTEYYTAFGPVKRIADSSETGAATNIITGLAVGMESTVIPVILICIAIGVSYFFAGLYGIGIGRRLRSHRGQRRRYQRDGRPGSRDAQDHGLAGRDRQHDGGHRQGFRHRVGGAHRVGALLRVLLEGRASGHGHRHRRSGGRGRAVPGRRASVLRGGPDHDGRRPRRRGHGGGSPTSVPGNSGHHGRHGQAGFGPLRGHFHAGRAP
jgi:K(+)-stimulated pyrophosphate-energized sodium pump